MPWTETIASTAAVTTPEAAPSDLPRGLVVGSDLGPRDQLVGTVAIRLAMMLETSVMLVHTLDTARDLPVRGPTTDAIERASEARIQVKIAAARTALDGERARIGAIDRHGHVVVRVALAEGRPWEMLVDLASELPRSWIVVGAREARSPAGATSERVLRHATGNVFVVPEGCNGALAGPVCVALDGGALSPRVLAAAREVARALDRPLEVLHVHVVPEPDPSSGPSGWMRDIGANDSSSLRWLPVGSSVAETIAEQLRTTATSLLVVGSHRAPPTVGRTLGPAVASLAQRSPVPVLIVR